MTRNHSRRSPAVAMAAEPCEPSEAGLPSDPMAYRLADVAVALGVSRRRIERELAAGRFPAPDLYHVEVPLWLRNSLVRWIARGGVQP